MAVPGAMGNFYHLQLSLTYTGTGRRDYLSKGFHQYVLNWSQFCWDILNRPTFLVEVFQSLPTALGFCDALVLGTAGIWINPNVHSSRFVWHLVCPRDIMEDLVSWYNLSVRIKNYDLGLEELLLQK